MSDKSCSDKDSASSDQDRILRHEETAASVARKRGNEEKAKSDGEVIADLGDEIGGPA